MCGAFHQQHYYNRGMFLTACDSYTRERCEAAVHRTSCSSWIRGGSKTSRYRWALIVLPIACCAALRSNSTIALLYFALRGTEKSGWGARQERGPFRDQRNGCGGWWGGCSLALVGVVACHWMPPALCEQSCEAPCLLCCQERRGHSGTMSLLLSARSVRPEPAAMTSTYVFLRVLIPWTLF